MFHVEARRKNRAGPVGAVYLQQEISHNSSAQYADGKSGNSNSRSQQNSAEADSDVVNQGRQRGYYELAFRILHRAQDASFVKTDLRGQHQECEENNARAFWRAEAGRDPVHDM